MNSLTEYIPELYATFWSLVPPLVAIILALITKEVYSSLFIGIIIGSLLYGGLFTAHFSLETSILHVFDDGLIRVLSNPSNIGILVFLVILGTRPGALKLLVYGQPEESGQKSVHSLLPFFLECLYS